MSQQDTKLEEKIAFVERHVEELDSVVRELYDKITALQQELARLREETGQRFGEIERSPQDDVPPHWGG